MGEQECHVHKTLDTEVVGEENVYLAYIWVQLRVQLNGTWNKKKKRKQNVEDFETIAWGGQIFSCRGLVERNW